MSNSHNNFQLTPSPSSVSLYSLKIVYKKVSCGRENRHIRSGGWPPPSLVVCACSLILLSLLSSDHKPLLCRIVLYSRFVGKCHRTFVFLYRCLVLSVFLSVILIFFVSYDYPINIYIMTNIQRSFILCILFYYNLIVDSIFFFYCRLQPYVVNIS